MCAMRSGGEIYANEDGYARGSDPTGIYYWRWICTKAVIQMNRLKLDVLEGSDPINGLN